MYVWIVWTTQSNETPRMSAIFSTKEEADKYATRPSTIPAWAGGNYTTTVTRQRLYHTADEVNPQLA